MCFTKKDGISNNAYFKYNRTNNNIHIYTGFYTDDAAGYAAALFIRGYWQVQDADIKICFSSDYSRANIVATKNEQGITFVLERKEYRDDEKAPDMLY